MDYCAHCAGGLLGNVIEFHPMCAQRILALWAVVKKFSDEQGDKGWAWDSDTDLWPAVKQILYGESSERVIKVKVGTDGQVSMEDISDEYTSLWQSLRNIVNQENGTYESDEVDEE